MDVVARDSTRRELDPSKDSYDSPPVEVTTWPEQELWGRDAFQVGRIGKKVNTASRGSGRLMDVLKTCAESFRGSYPTRTSPLDGPGR
jgi:hypothetical protein